jgi:hypothetical protein
MNVGFLTITDPCLETHTPLILMAGIGHKLT